MRHLLPLLFALTTHGHPTWQRCQVHLDYRTMRTVTARQCHRFVIHHPPGKVIGHERIERYISPHVRLVVRYPRFQRPSPRLAGPTIMLSVSAYAWGCGASQAMSDGRMPYVGAAAGVFPTGTRLMVPGWGEVTVEDTGVPPGYLDLFAQDCAQAWAWGRRELPVTVG